MKNTLVGTKIVKQVTYQIEIMSLSKEVPNETIPDFIDWLQSQAIENGIGKHHDYYYGDSEYWYDNIAATFNVKTI